MTQEAKQFDKLNTIVRVCTGTENTEQRKSSDGNFCEVVSICNEPTYQLRDSNGHHFHWAQSLTRPASEQETIEYWKNRAIIAEEKNQAPKR